jgi:hypothetical protein
MARAGACIQVRSSLYPFVLRTVQLALFCRINAAERGCQRVAQGNMAGPQTTCMQQATPRMGPASSSACRSCDAQLDWSSRLVPANCSGFLAVVLCLQANSCAAAVTSRKQPLVLELATTAIVEGSYISVSNSAGAGRGCGRQSVLEQLAAFGECKG